LPKSKSLPLSLLFPQRSLLFNQTLPFQDTLCDFALRSFRNEKKNILFLEKKKKKKRVGGVGGGGKRKKKEREVVWG